MSVSPAERLRAYRARQREAGLPDITRKNRKHERKVWKSKRSAESRNRPFIGCDGEGCGTDEVGRQNFMLFRMGERELYTGRPLSTWELLDFICDEPPYSILVGFAFGYDVTMILRDLSPQQQKRLFEPKQFGKGHSPFVWYKEFDIDYLPKNYLKIRRVKIERESDGAERRVAIKGSTRTIYETFGFFQKSFLKVLHEFEVGTKAELELIASNKDARSGFNEITPEIRAYCAMECQFLAELMEKLRDYCTEGGIVPRTWSGAGKLASALHAKNETPKGAALREVVPPEVEGFAAMAYFGGRFEISRVGAINQKVFEYDIRSAYPAAMSSLPCLLHGTWRHEISSRNLSRETGIFVAGVSFKAKPTGGYGQLGALPIRSKEGHLYWPLQGAGVYWSCEIESAKKLGFEIRYKEGWVYEKHCDCKPFDWVEELYDYRQSIGSSGAGYPIKLGINSLYGKLAQRKGNGAYHNMVWAGLITAITRSKLNLAINQSVERYGPGRIIMLATDALYSLDPLPDLELGYYLGAWDRTELEDLFIVQPGLYWSPDKRKRKGRGLPGKFFEQAGMTENFEASWKHFEGAENSMLDLNFPSVTVPLTNFVGLKIALARGKSETAGKWVDETRDISFDYRNKRTGHKWVNGHIVTKPKLGGPKCISLPHREFLAQGGAETWEAARSMLEDQPDYIDLGIPFKD
jgi:hypothetical protein